MVMGTMIVEGNKSQYALVILSRWPFCLNNKDSATTQQWFSIGP